MIDEERLNKIHLHPIPHFQKIVGTLMLMPNYNLPGRKTEIVLENADNIPPEGGCIFVMNHTDRYNYWPFQYQLWREKRGFTATWVKGKYYENPYLALFMDLANNVPLPSKGYVITKDFQGKMERTPTADEYKAVKAYVDGKLSFEDAIRQGGRDVAGFLVGPWKEGDSYAEDLEARFIRMMQRVVAITKEGLAERLNLLIFPQGTRSKRLTKGHTGAAQMILHTEVPVIPVGCNGSDKAYPGNSPLSSGGRIVYRIGKPLTVKDALKRFRIKEPFVPFTDSAAKHQATFRRLTDYLMDRINDLLDPEYQYGEDEERERGADRFL